MRPGLHKAHAQMGQEIFLKDLILTMRVQAWCLKQRKEKKKETNIFLEWSLKMIYNYWILRIRDKLNLLIPSLFEIGLPSNRKEEFLF